MVDATIAVKADAGAYCASVAVAVVVVVVCGLTVGLWTLRAIPDSEDISSTSAPPDIFGIAAHFQLPHETCFLDEFARAHQFHESQPHRSIS